MWTAVIDRARSANEVLIGTARASRVVCGDVVGWSQDMSEQDFPKGAWSSAAETSGLDDDSEQ